MAAGADMNIGNKVSLTISVVIVAHALSGIRALAGMPCSGIFGHASPGKVFSDLQYRTKQFCFDDKVSGGWSSCVAS